MDLFFLANTSTDSFVDKEEGYVGSQGSSDEGETSKQNTSTEMTYGEKFRKTLRLTSEQIVSFKYFDYLL